jgi:hypothetical protein
MSEFDASIEDHSSVVDSKEIAHLGNLDDWKVQRVEWPVPELDWDICGFRASWQFHLPYTVIYQGHPIWGVAIVPEEITSKRDILLYLMPKRTPEQEEEYDKKVASIMSLRKEQKIRQVNECFLPSELLEQPVDDWGADLPPRVLACVIRIAEHRAERDSSQGTEALQQ